jgi:uncharacterized protein (TIGR03067 family)
MKRFVFVVSIVMAIAGGQDKKDDGNRDLDRLRGTWKVVSIIQNGREVPNASDNSISFDAQNVTIKEKNGQSKGTCTLDAAKEPKHIDLIPDNDKGKKVQAIYSLKGDELKLCLAAPGRDRPTKFESKPGSRYRLVILKRGN